MTLRLEDHDRGRCRPEYERAILEDLEWLGLTWSSQCRQSDRDQIYTEALARLSSSYQVYACECSRKEIAADADWSDEPRYSGRCRDRGLEVGPGRGIRVVLEEGEERFVDQRMGDQRQEPARQCGDLLLRDRLGNWTYQFCVTVDDIEQGIDLVIRGEDLLASTGRQIRLARMLGRSNPPAFFHHPLIRHPAGAKLSKSNRDTGIRELRDSGMTPAAVLGLAAHRVGLLHQPSKLPASELGHLFPG